MTQLTNKYCNWQFWKNDSINGYPNFKCKQCNKTLQINSIDIKTIEIELTKPRRCSSFNQSFHTTKPPNIFQRTKNYLKERHKWVKSGKQYRSLKLIEYIYDTFCKNCEHNINNDGNNLCNICGCFIAPQGTKMNKLAWTTTKCPDDPPRWIQDTNVSLLSFKTINKKVEHEQLIKYEGKKQRELIKEKQKMYIENIKKIREDNYKKQVIKQKNKKQTIDQLTDKLGIDVFEAHKQHNQSLNSVEITSQVKRALINKHRKSLPKSKKGCCGGNKK